MKFSKVDFYDWETVNIPFRFILHYADETLDYLRRKIIPKSDIEGIRTICYFYSSNSQEKGEILNNDALKLFEEITKRI